MYFYSNYPIKHYFLIKRLRRRQKKYIVECLLNGKTNLLEEGEKYKDKGLSETTYEYAMKCLNMLLHDICTNNKSYIIKDFENAKVLSPQNIIDIKMFLKIIVKKTTI